MWPNINGCSTGCRSIWAAPASGAKLPTDQRIQNFADGNDPQLAALYFQFGRYLLICSSRPGGQPANLQGLWNESMTPPWDSKYTININTEMNYWPAEPCNLASASSRSSDMVMDLTETGARTAQVHYGARGWVAHHNTDFWRAPRRSMVRPSACGRPAARGFASTCGIIIYSAATKNISQKFIRP